MESPFVTNFTDEVERLACSIGGDVDGDGSFFRIVDDQLCRSYLRLLPPMDVDGVTIWVGRARGIQTQLLACLGMKY